MNKYIDKINSDFWRYLIHLFSSFQCGCWVSWHSDVQYFVWNFLIINIGKIWRSSFYQKCFGKKLTTYHRADLFLILFFFFLNAWWKLLMWRLLLFSSGIFFPWYYFFINFPLFSLLSCLEYLLQDAGLPDLFTQFSSMFPALI